MAEGQPKYRKGDLVELPAGGPTGPWRVRGVRSFYSKPVYVLVHAKDPRSSRSWPVPDENLLTPAMMSLDTVIDELRAVGAREVWLYGSRANGRDRPGSDYDLLVHASPSTLDALRQRQPWPDFHVLVGHNRETFTTPWPHEGHNDIVSLSGLRWRCTSPSTAQYEGTYETKPGFVSWRKCTAKRLYP